MSDVKYPRHSTPRMLSGTLHIHEIVMYNISNCSTFNWNSPGDFNIDVFYYWLLSLIMGSTNVCHSIVMSVIDNQYPLSGRELSLQVHHTAAVMQTLVCVTLPQKSVQIHMGICTWATMHRAHVHNYNNILISFLILRSWLNLAHCLHRFKSRKSIYSLKTSQRITSSLICTRVVPVFDSSMSIRSTRHGPNIFDINFGYNKHNSGDTAH